MATGNFDSWANVDTLGPIYPFVGSEGILCIVILIWWIGWHIVQLRREAREVKDDLERIQERGGVVKVLDEEGDRELNDMIGR